jgi:N-acetylglucosamine kinase-like BadF-type ATPase
VNPVKPGGEPAVLAIDGGNSKTDVALVANDGRLLRAARGPGMPRNVSVHTVVGRLQKLIAGMRFEGGRRNNILAVHTSACLANVDLPGEDTLLADALAGMGWSATTEVVNDTFAVLRAGVEGPSREGVDAPFTWRPWGVAVVCGTGINCIARHPDGRVTGFLALGDPSGDWGGGEFLGRAALWHAMRAEDGRGPDSALRAVVTAHFHAESVRDVVVAMKRGVICEELRGLVPGLLAAARDGDPAARSLLDRQAEEIVTLALVAMTRLDLQGRPTPIVLGGGVVTASAELRTVVATRIASQAPLATVRIAGIPPVAGAALLGLDRLGIAPHAERRLRAAFTRLRLS